MNKYKIMNGLDTEIMDTVEGLVRQGDLVEAVLFCKEVGLEATYWRKGNMLRTVAEGIEMPDGYRIEVTI